MPRPKSVISDRQKELTKRYHAATKPHGSVAKFRHLAGLNTCSTHGFQHQNRAFSEDQLDRIETAINKAFGANGNTPKETKRSPGRPKGSGATATKSRREIDDLITTAKARAKATASRSESPVTIDDLITAAKDLNDARVEVHAAQARFNNLTARYGEQSAVAA